MAGMRALAILIVLLLPPLSALAGTAEAKDVARSYNCKVTAIDLVETRTGNDATAIYKASCELPASSTEDQKKANGSLLIRCDGPMCSLMKKGE